MHLLTPLNAIVRNSRSRVPSFLATYFVDRQNGLFAIFRRKESRFAFMYSVYSYQRKIIKNTHLNYPVCELLCKMIWLYK